MKEIPANCSPTVTIYNVFLPNFNKISIKQKPVDVRDRTTRATLEVEPWPESIYDEWNVKFWWIGVAHPQNELFPFDECQNLTQTRVMLRYAGVSEYALGNYFCELKYQGTDV